MKIRYFIPVTSLDIKELIKAFIYTIYKLYGALNAIISNKGFLFILGYYMELGLRVTFKY